MRFAPAVANLKVSHQNAPRYGLGRDGFTRGTKLYSGSDRRIGDPRSDRSFLGIEIGDAGRELEHLDG